MKRSVVFSATMIIATACLAAGSGTKADKSPAKPFVSFSYSKDIMGTYAGRDGKTIYSDGSAEEYSVDVPMGPPRPGKPAPQEKRKSTKLTVSPEEMKELKTLLRESKFFEMDGSEIQKRAKLRRFIADANTIELKASLDGKTNAVSIYALDSDAYTLAPEVGELKDLKNIYGKIRSAGRTSSKGDMQNQ